MSAQATLWDQLLALPWPGWATWALHCDCRDGGHWYVSFNGSVFTAEYPTRAEALQAAIARAQDEQGSWHRRPRKERVA